MMQIKSISYFTVLCLPQLGSMPAVYAFITGGCDWSIQ